MKLELIPNALCVVRLVMVPVLWVLAFWVRETFELELGQRVLFVALLAFAFFTDFIDGVICRKYDLSTRFGAKFDRLSDDLLTLNSVGYLYLLRREFFTDYWFVLVALLGMMFLSVGLQFWRFKRKVAFHLYAGKTANWFIAAFACCTLLFGPLAWFVYLMAAVTAYALFEEIYLVLTRKELDEHVTSIWARPAAEPEPDE